MSGLSPTEHRAWTAYRAARSHVDAGVARDLENGSGLSMPDHDVLAGVAAIAASSGHCVRVGALADRMGWSRSRLSRQLGRMEQRGLIARVPCALDGRGDDVELTGAGRRALDEARPGLDAAVRARFLDALSPAQLAALTEICETLAAG